MKRTNNHSFGVAKSLYLIIYCILFYISCYFMIPHKFKLLFLIGFCFCGFAVPWIPLLIDEKVKRKVIIVAIHLLLYIPIVLFIIYGVKFSQIANHNYVIPNTSGIQYKISVDWELLENKYVGEDFTQFIYCESKEDRIKYNTVYFAPYGEVIDLSLRVREDDPYDESEFAIQDITIPVEIEFGNVQIVSQIIELGAETELNYEGRDFIDGGGYFRPEDYGSATWKCTVTVKRLFDFWEVVSYR